MKKYKLKPMNSYYYYKKRKLWERRLIAMGIAMVIIGGALIGSGRVSADLSALNPFRNVNKKLEIESVYLNTAPIQYELYKAPKDARGIYIPASKLKNYEEYIALAKETAVNSFVIDVKSDYGYLTFESTNPTLVEMGCVLATPPITDLKKIMSRLYEENIYPIARIVAFKDSVATAHFPDRAIKDLNGNVYTNSSGDLWLNPYDKRNWEYLLEISKEAINMGFKEIQFDYIRFHESMNANRVQLDPDKSKSEIITEFTAYMYENLKGYGALVSADVFGAVILSDIDGETVGQNFVEMSKHLDYICPMVYPSHYAPGTFGIEYPHLDGYGIILKTMKLATKRLSEGLDEERQAIIRPWLQDFTISTLKPYQEYGEQEILAQIQGTYDAGLNEWLFWNAAGRYTREGLNDK